MIKKDIFSAYGVDTGKFTQLAHAMREQRAIKNDFERNKKIIEAAVRPSPPTSDSATTLAAKIIECGKVARGELPSPSLEPPKGSVAAEILRLGRVRRGEE
jgi:hypothetical protein